jgi:hypothetical protein
VICIPFIGIDTLDNGPATSSIGGLMEEMVASISLYGYSAMTSRAFEIYELTTKESFGLILFGGYPD